MKENREKDIWDFTFEKTKNTYQDNSPPPKFPQVKSWYLKLEESDGH